MDPFAALSTAAAIAQFVELSVGLVTKAYDAYSSVSGLPAEDEQLGFIMSELSRLSDAMVCTKPGSEQSNADKALDRIATKCDALAKQLLVVLGRIKAKEPHSRRSSAAAALRSWWNEKEKKQLKAQVEECRKLLQIQLTITMGSDTVRTLRHLAQTGLANETQLASLQKHVGALQKGVTLSHLGTEAEAELASLLKLSDTALDSIANHRILNCLSFPEMHRRYRQVGKAFSDTFEWIFEENPQKDDRALRGRCIFTEWLESGNGIFHIAGKPGAGKSTLMKFLHKHQRTKQYLESWAEDRKLVVSKFFFWRTGSEMENSITAMVRTLLFEVFEQCPELIQRTFPQQWSLVRGLPWQAAVQLNFDGDEIRDAFNRLLEHSNQGGKHCFCLFIDGLDEFRESRDEGYKTLNSLLSDWTKKSPVNIKVGVSSREYIVFQDSFQGSHGLKLQDLTCGDILTFVRKKLERNHHYLALEKPEGEEDILITQVEERASGVFLWVALVVQMLDDACDHQDTFEELQRKLEFTPPEIEDLLQQLFDSIHISDRDQSAQTFAIILSLLESETDPHLSLFRYSLLDEYNHDPEFASKLDFEDQIFSHQDFVPRLEKARRQLYKRCKGLLEIVNSDNRPLGGEVRLTHRSVHEFLLRSKMEDERSARLQSFDVFNAIYQTLVAETALLYSREPAHSHPHFPAELEHTISHLARLGPDSEKFMPALWNLQIMYIRRFKPGFDHHDVHTGRWAIDVGGQSIMVEFLSVSHYAARMGLRQYFTSTSRPSSFAVDEVEYASLVLVTLFGIGESGPSHYEQNRILRWIFQQGCSPNQIHGDVSLWTIFLTSYLEHDNLLRDPYVAEGVQIFLESGAHRDVSLSYSGKGYLEVKVIPPNTTMTQIQGDGAYMFAKVEHALKQFDDSPVTLRSYISNSEVPNKESLLALLDQTPLTQQEVTASSAELLESTPDGEETPPRDSIRVEDVVGESEDTGLDRGKVTAEQVITRVRSVLRNPLFTFALGSILSVFFTYCGGKIWGWIMALFKKKHFSRKKRR